MPVTSLLVACCGLVGLVLPVAACGYLGSVVASGCMWLLRLSGC